MEIKRIKEESFESVSKYLEVLLSIVPNYYELCFVDYNNRRYMVGIGDGKIAVVENDNGSLNGYSISQEDILKTEYNTEEKECIIVDTDTIKEVHVTDRLTGNEERVSYLTPDDDFDQEILEYAQSNESSVASLLTKYDVKKRGSLQGSLLYTNFHNPDVLELRRLKSLLGIFYSKYDMYAADVNDENKYYSPFINLGGLHIGVKPTILTSDELFKFLSELGFKNVNKSYAASILGGTNEEYNNISLITDEYKKYIKRQ